MARPARGQFRGFGLGVMRRLRRTQVDEAQLVIRECRRLSSGGVFFDIGANVGDVAEAMLPHASRIVAVEPEPASFARLSQRLGSRAICVQALVGPNGDQRTFLTNTIATTSSASVAPGDEPHGHDYLKQSTMQAVSLDALAAAHGMPGVVKIDVEGFEISVLRSAPQVIASRPIVVMEFNALCLSNFGRVNPRDAIDFVLATFPRVDVITQEGTRPLTDPYVFLSENILQHGSVDNIIGSWE